MTATIGGSLERRGQSVSAAGSKFHGSSSWIFDWGWPAAIFSSVLLSQTCGSPGRAPEDYTPEPLKRAGEPDNPVQLRPAPGDWNREPWRERIDIGPDVDTRHSAYYGPP